MSADMELSILIATVSPRKSLLSRLLQNLEGQLSLHPGQAEVIVHANDDMPLGEKWMELYQVACGRLSVQVDDDDLVAADFITAVLGHSHGHDFVGYRMRFSLWGDPVTEDYYIDPARHRSMKPYSPIDDKVRIMSPKCPVLTEHARKFEFESYYGSDFAFIAKLIRDGYPFNPVFIDRALYYYDCWPNHSLGMSRETWTWQRETPTYDYDPEAFIWIW